jgi:hypothetical protein
MAVQPSLSLVELLEYLHSFGKSTVRQAPLSNSGGKASILFYEEFWMQQVKDRLVAKVLEMRFRK